MPAGVVGLAFIALSAARIGLPVPAGVGGLEFVALSGVRMGLPVPAGVGGLAFVALSGVRMGLPVPAGVGGLALCPDATTRGARQLTAYRKSRTSAGERLADREQGPDQIWPSHRPAVTGGRAVTGGGP
ncbi:hypothetical protein GCM10010168_92990 [Actinoplanes ianthinogenes]|nr:hypothetical protein GCM10010168_92990 [Actinoplanes ianthinogenes]